MHLSRFAGVLVTACLCSFVSATQAKAQIAYVPCANSNDFACSHLKVPLDPSGGTPGTITLAIRRHRAPVGEAKDAIVPLAGGPGQAALPFAEQFAHVLGPIADTRDLIVFDQRGIGRSEPLSCHRFEISEATPSGPTIGECAAQLGPTRTFYGTAETVADIEALRVAGGYEKLVLYGTSYGTKVAEEYAQAYPSRVEALVLDSVVPPNGPEPLNRPTFAAIPRILSQLCARRACAHLTRSPVGDLARLVRRLARGPLVGRLLDGSGVAHTVRISSDGLLGTLVEGDLEPVLRSELPAAVRSAVEGDTAALARLQARAESGEEGEPGEAENPSESFDNPLYYATSCEDQQFPWKRSSSPTVRLAEAKKRIRALPPRQIAPFRAANLLDLSDIPACAFWPFTTPAPAPQHAPFPRVPTLILSGAEDLRTPTSNARELAARIPGSRLLVLPDSGHSVLGSDTTGCASAALHALFLAKPIKACTATRPPSILHLTPLAPTRLRAIPPAKHSRGLPGRTLEAVALTLGDFERQLELQLAAAGVQLGGPTSVRVGGLRSGWAGLVREVLTFHRYTYVPGVTISGTLGPGASVLRIGGRAGADGTLRLGPHMTLSGVLGGSRVRLTGGASRAVTAGMAPLQFGDR